MSSRRATVAFIPVLAAVVAIGAGGCGSSQEEIEQARKQAAEQQRLKDKAAELEDEIKQLKEQQAQLVQTQTTPGSTTQTQTTQSPAGPSRNCGGGVAAGPDTSCAFALNTAKEWVDTSGGTTIQVYSPATKKTYTMNCSTGSQGTTCKGGNGAIVYIP